MTRPWWAALCWHTLLQLVRLDVPISPDQLQQLQTKVAKLAADDGAYDTAKAASDAAATTLATAQADVAAKGATLTQAGGLVNADLADLQAFVNGLVNPPTPPQ